MNSVDFRIHNDGSMIGFTPVSEAAQDFIDEKVESEPWQWLGHTLWIDQRCAEALIGGIANEGLEIEQ